MLQHRTRGKTSAATEEKGKRVTDIPAGSLSYPVAKSCLLDEKSNRLFRNENEADLYAQLFP